MSGPLIALVLTTVVHLIGLVVLLWVMGPDLFDMFRLRPSDEGGGGGEPPAPEPVGPPAPSGGGLPLPDAAQSPVRLREPSRLAERYPRPARRPEHDPAPSRDPERA